MSVPIFVTLVVLAALLGIIVLELYLADRYEKFVLRSLRERPKTAEEICYDVKLGANVYASLQALEHRGYIRSWKAAEDLYGERNKRYYALTPLGITSFPKAK